MAIPSHIRNEAAIRDVHNVPRTVLFLHGGPGGSTSIANTAFFDPAVYRVVLYDQRGAGKSTPAAELHENETSYLLADIEVLREHLRIPKWHVVFGGSWGSTLALLYAQAHPERMISLVLRGIFLARKSEIAWDLPTRESGAAQLFPDAAEEMLSHFTEEEQEDVMASLYKRLVSDNKETRVEAARVSNTWDIKRSSLLLDSASLNKIDDEKWSLQHAILGNHFLINGAWLREGQILEKENVDKIRHLPCKWSPVRPSMYHAYVLRCHYPRPL